MGRPNPRQTKVAPNNRRYRLQHTPRAIQSKGNEKYSYIKAALKRDFRLYDCESCGKRFPRPYDLGRHNKRKRKCTPPKGGVRSLSPAEISLRKFLERAKKEEVYMAMGDFLRLLDSVATDPDTSTFSIACSNRPGVFPVSSPGSPSFVAGTPGVQTQPQPLLYEQTRNSVNHNTYAAMDYASMSWNQQLYGNPPYYGSGMEEQGIECQNQWPSMHMISMPCTIPNHSEYWAPVWPWCCGEIMVQATPN